MLIHFDFDSFLIAVPNYISCLQANLKNYGINFQSRKVNANKVMYQTSTMWIEELIYITKSEYFEAKTAETIKKYEKILKD